jgi:hypothetical protein
VSCAVQIYRFRVHLPNERTERYTAFARCAEEFGIKRAYSKVASITLSRAEVVMAKIIEFCIPDFYVRAAKEIPHIPLGKLIEFPYTKDDPCVLTGMMTEGMGSVFRGSYTTDLLKNLKRRLSPGNRKKT